MTKKELGGIPINPLKMDIIDLTGYISEDIWNYGPPFSAFERKQISTVSSHGYISYEYKLFSHMGTHIDSEAHFLEAGSTIDEISLDTLYGTAFIIQIKNCKALYEIGLDDIGYCKNKILENDIVLIATGWDRNWNNVNYVSETPFISTELAEWFIEKKVKLLATDTALCCNPQKGLFFNPKNVNLPDLILLKGKIPYINGLVNLKLIIQDRIIFLALPLKIKHAEGTPVRAIGFL